LIGASGDGPRHDERAAGEAVNVAGRHQVGAVAREADDFGDDRHAVATGDRVLVDLAHRADRTRMPAASRTRPVTRTSRPCVSSGNVSLAAPCRSARYRCHFAVTVGVVALSS
jgi:hypothetical protein